MSNIFKKIMILSDWLKLNKFGQESISILKISGLQKNVGWIDPAGNFHDVGDESHQDWIEKKENIGFDLALSEGWVRVTFGGTGYEFEYQKLTTSSKNEIISILVDKVKHRGIDIDRTIYADVRFNESLKSYKLDVASFVKLIAGKDGEEQFFKLLNEDEASQDE